MEEKVKWVKRQIECPEEKGRAELLLEWRLEEGSETLNSISCNNPKIKDLSGEDCEWSCWEKITGEKD